MTPFVDTMRKAMIALFIMAFGSAIGAIAVGARAAALLFTGAAIASSLTLLLIDFVNGRRQ